VLAACIKDRRFELANSLIENLNNMSMDVQLASTVIKFYCKTNRLKKAIEFHDKMLQAGIVPNEITYTILIAGCIKAGELDVANALYLRFKSGGKQSLELTNTIIKMHCENGQMDTAMKLFHSSFNNWLYRQQTLLTWGGSNFTIY
jgi:pentatricopeptide repeat protein